MLLAKIHVIKAVRQVALNIGLPALDGLKDAKDFTDALEQELNKAGYTGLASEHACPEVPRRITSVDLANYYNARRAAEQATIEEQRASVRLARAQRVVDNCRTAMISIADYILNDGPAYTLPDDPNDDSPDHDA